MSEMNESTAREARRSEEVEAMTTKKDKAWLKQATS
jgi:hypothetical protein